MKPKFSVCVIAKNEEQTLPRLLKSLEPFRQRGGEVCVLDTGSTDNTLEIAKQHGCVVACDTAFMVPVQNHMAINQKFVRGNDKAIVKAGDQYFNFSAARNHVAGMASNDVVFFYDADEVSEVMDIDKINSFIESGTQQFEYAFVFAYDHFGKEAVKFNQSKAYDRRVMEWRGIVHELVSPKESGIIKRTYLDEPIYRLGHHQNHESGRHIYLTGLAVDAFNNPSNDRHSHYLARELMWSGRYHSAIEEFKRHVKMNGWAAERAQSHIYMGRCYAHLNNPEEQVKQINKAIYIDSKRREAYIEMARFYKHNDNFQAAACYAAAALEIPYDGYYGNDMAHYTYEPHAILYWAKGFMGDIAGAQHHILKALEYQPHHPEFLRDTQYYFEYPDNGIDGWMRFPELQWLYEQGKKYNYIVEVGSWKGRSTHALLSGAAKRGGRVVSVDTWNGSTDERDLTNILAKQEDVFEVFRKNIRGFNHITVVKQESVEAAKQFADKSVDMVFIDAGHTKEDVIADIQAWLPKCTKIICGHDYTPGTWMTVCEGVDEVFGKPDGVVDSIWWVDLEKRNEVGSMVVFKGGKITVPKGSDVDMFLKDHPRNLDNVISSEAVGIVESSEKIPRRIVTCWLSEDGSMPELIKKCIDSQKKFCEENGYEHNVVTLDWAYTAGIRSGRKYYLKCPYCPPCEHDAPNLTGGNKYLQDALRAKKWVKATDFIRMHYLWHGGLFLDADVEVLPGQTFNQFLTYDAFVGKEHNPGPWQVLGTAVMGAAPYHPWIDKWIKTVVANFKGDDDLYYESSMDVMNKLYFEFADKIHVADREVFFPYDHKTDTIVKTERTITYHHFNKSWVKKKSVSDDGLPEVLFIIPTLGREEGLKRCIASIEALNYPPDKIRYFARYGPETVPNKVKKTFDEIQFGEWIVYASNDVEFTPDSLRNAIEAAYERSCHLVAFNTGPVLPDEGNVCEHFLINRHFVKEYLNGQIFDIKFNHVGCDNYLWAQVNKFGRATRAENAIVKHYHFSNGEVPMDDVYFKGWQSDRVKADRELLAMLLEQLGN